MKIIADRRSLGRLLNKNAVDRSKLRELVTRIRAELKIINADLDQVKDAGRSLNTRVTTLEDDRVAAIEAAVADLTARVDLLESP